MRKFSLVFAALLIVASGAFAQEINPVLTFEAEAEAIFGVNLDGTAASDDGATTGFAVSTDVTLEIEFVEEQTAEFGEGETYGWIEVEDFKIVADGDGTDGNAGDLEITDGDVTGKVFFGPAYLLVATAENDVNVAGEDNVIDTSIIGVDDIVSDGNEGISVALGFDVPDLLNVEAVIGSDQTWTTNNSNGYKLALLTETTVSGFTITVDASTWVNRDPDNDATTDNSLSFGEDAIVGAGIEYELPLNDTFTANPFVGFDFYSNDAGDTKWEVVGGAYVGWEGTDDDVDFFGQDDIETVTGVGVDFGYGSDDTGADTVNGWFARLGFYETEGDDGLLPVVGAALLAEVAGNDVDSTGLAFGLAAEINADLGVVSPYFGLITADDDMDKDGVGDDLGLTLNVGTDIEVIDNVTFNIDYKSGNLLTDRDDSAIVYAADSNYEYEAALDDVTTKAGQIQLTTTISY